MLSLSMSVTNVSFVNAQTTESIEAEVETEAVEAEVDMEAVEAEAIMETVSGGQLEYSEVLEAGDEETAPVYNFNVDSLMERYEIISLPNRTEYYYGLDSELSIDGLALKLFYDDGTEMIFDDEDHFGITDGGRNWDGYYPKGELRVTVYIRGALDRIEIPFQILDPYEIPKVISVGETEKISGGMRTNDYVKIDIPHAGGYSLRFDQVAEGELEIFNSDYRVVASEWNNDIMYFIAPTPGEYYLKTETLNSFNVTLKQEKIVEELRINRFTDSFYEDLSKTITPRDLLLDVYFDDGTKETIEYRSAEWFELGFNSMDYLNGEYWNSDVVAGKGYYHVWNPLMREEVDIPFEVKHKEEAPILSLGSKKPVVSLGYSYYQMKVSRSGYYDLFYSPEEGDAEHKMLAIWDSDGEHLTTEDFPVKYYFEGGKTYYLRTDCDKPGVIRLESSTLEFGLNEAADAWYDSFGQNSLNNILEGIDFYVCYADGSKKTCNYRSPEVENYRFTYELLDAKNGNRVANDNIPAGEYMLHMVSQNTAMAVLFPITIKSTTELEELPFGVDMIFNRAAAFRIPGDEAGMLRMKIKSDSEVHMLAIVDHTEYGSPFMYNIDCGPQKLKEVYLCSGRLIHIDPLEGTGIQVVVEKMPAIKKVSISGSTHILPYGIWGARIGEVSGSTSVKQEMTEPMQPFVGLIGDKWNDIWSYYGNYVWFPEKVTFTFADNSTISTYMGMELWNAAGFKQTILSTDGEIANSDENGYIPIGDYLAVFDGNGYSFEVPFSVVESSAAKDIRKSTVTIEKQIYAGHEVYPVPKVVYENKVLKLNEDFYVRYVNNHRPGTAMAEIFGKGDYSGKMVVPFYIVDGTEKLDSPILSAVTNTIDGVKVTWKVVTGAEAYRVFRKTEGGSWTKLKDVTTNKYTDTTAKSGVRYFYTVRCVTANGSEYTSDCNTKGLAIDYVAAPVISGLSCSAAGIKVTWTAVNGAGSYRVYYKTVGGSWTKAADTKATELTVSGLKEGTEYYFTVRCMSSDKSTFLGAYDTVGKSVVYAGSLKTPVLESATCVQNGVRVKWTAVTGATNYRVYRKVAGGSWTRLGDVKTTTFVDEKAESGVTYSYTVKCMSDDGTKALSSYDKNGVSVTYIAAPVIKTLTNNISGVKVTWEAVVGAGKYRVYRKTAGGSWGKVADVNTNSFVDSTAVSGTGYIYTVRCMSEDGKNFISAYDTVGKSIFYLAAPKLVGAYNTTAGAQARVKWEAVNGAKGYYVYRKEAGSSWTKIKTISNPATLYYIDKTLAVGKTYYYTVKGFNDNTTSSHDSAGVKILVK